MANSTIINSKLTMGEGSNEKTIHYETDTLNITDFNPAVNSLIEEATPGIINQVVSGNNTFTGTNIFNNNVTFGKPAIFNDNVQINHDLDLNGDLDLKYSKITSTNSKTTLLSKNGSYVELGNNGGVVIKSTGGAKTATLTIDGENGKFTYDGSIDLSGDIYFSGDSSFSGEATFNDKVTFNNTINTNTSGNIFNLPYGKIKCTDNSTIISTNNGASLELLNTGGFKINPKDGDSSLILNGDTGELSYDSTVNFGGNINLSGIVTSDIKLNYAVITSSSTSTRITDSVGNYIGLFSDGTIRLFSNMGLASLDIDSNGILNYEKTVKFTGPINLAGNITSSLKLPNATITSTSTKTDIVTTSGGSISIKNSNSDGTVTLTTKAGSTNHTLVVTTTGKVTIDGDILCKEEDAFNMAHPIGDIVMTTTNINPGNTTNGMFKRGTWVAIAQGYTLAVVSDTSNLIKDTNGYPGKISAGGNTEGTEWHHTMTSNELVSHNHTATCTDAGRHRHDKGDMNITGYFGLDDMGAQYHGGAFYDTQWGYNSGAQRTETGPIMLFDASKSWSGHTSYEGTHSHTITIDKAGSTSPIAFTNVPPYFGIYLWQRTA